MASGSTVTVESLLEERYGNIPQPILSAIEYREFSNEEFKKIEQFSIRKENILTDNDLHAAGNMLKASLSNGFSGETSMRNLFSLAINLRNPEDLKQLLLSEPSWGTKSSNNFLTSGFSANSSSSRDVMEPRQKNDRELEAEAEASFKTPNTEGLSASDAKLKIDESKRAHIEAYKGQYAFNYGREFAIYQKEHKEKGTVESGASPYFWPFVASYLLKIYIKAPENVLLGMTNMKDRFLTFYPAGQLGEVNTSNDSLNQLALKIKSHKTMLNTWISYTAEFESTKDSTSQGAGLIRYLANIQFGFNGMHGYGLFREVLLATRWKPGQAIMKMWMDPTSDALDLIGLIMTRYESIIKPDGSSEKRPSYFKYARVVDPRFFLPLQPSQCLSLLYLCCKILNHYISRTELTNPLRMFALSKLGEEQRNFLDTFAEVVLSDDQADTTHKTKIEQAALIRHREKKEEAENLRAEEASNVNLISEMRDRMKRTRV
ncbi:TPA_asm: N [Zanthoxylum betacytorhabdovirus 1]|nr:TPA_asm: N [Zanthoxilum betacytorhabdovirus 1]